MNVFKLNFIFIYKFKFLMKSSGLTKIDDKSKFFIEYPSELESVYINLLLSLIKIKHSSSC